MIINLDKKTRIETDTNNWIISNMYQSKKTGQIRWRQKHFYQTLESLVDEYCEERIRDFDLLLDKKTLSKIFNEIANLKSEIFKEIQTTIAK